MRFRAGIKRAEIANAIDNYVSGTVGSDMPLTVFESMFDEGAAPPALTAEQRRAWAQELDGVALASDAFFPFRDNIDRARLVGANIERDNSIVRSICNRFFGDWQHL